MAAATSRAAGLVLGLAADRILGDPQRWHPVAGLGRVAGWLEGRMWRDHPAAGAAHLVAVAAPPTALAVLVERATRGRPLLHATATAATVWAATGAAQLAQVGETVHDALAAGDLGAARRLMPSLVGRDPDTLGAADMARATVESLAENTCDAAAGTILWLVLAGMPGVVAHRIVNTLDAMVGHRSPRHARFGTAAARADDVLGWLPARTTAWATVLLSSQPARSRSVWRRDACRHPSPNAGPVEATAAGALGVTLGGATTYRGRVEVRGPLGDGPPPTEGDIPRAVELSRRLVTCLGIAGVAAVLVTPALSRRCPTGGRR